jgi:hypothetical protein
MRASFAWIETMICGAPSRRVAINGHNAIARIEGLNEQALQDQRHTVVPGRVGEIIHGGCRTRKRDAGRIEARRGIGRANRKAPCHGCAHRRVDLRPQNIKLRLHGRRQQLDGAAPGKQARAGHKNNLPPAESCA